MIKYIFAIAFVFCLYKYDSSNESKYVWRMLTSFFIFGVLFFIDLIKELI